VADSILDILQNTAARQPLGSFETRCDEKGRIRLPSEWLHFIAHDLKDTRVFCTSLDSASTIRIYPESIWRYNLALFEQQLELAAEVDALLTNADYYGVLSTPDTSGRVLIKAELRARMELLGDLVVGTGKRGVIHVYRKTDHQALLVAAAQAVPDAIQKLTRAGMR